MESKGCGVERSIGGEDGPKFIELGDCKGVEGVEGIIGGVSVVARGVLAEVGALKPGG